MNDKFGSWIAGGNSQKGRKENDFYPTPSWCTEIVLKYTKPPKDIWEPACGDGAISKVLIKNGFNVVSTDLHFYNFGIPEMDFLKSPKLSNAVITNPPFVIASDFIEKCIQLDLDYFAMLLKSQYWHAASRKKLFEKQPPSKILAMTKRPDFLGSGKPTMDCIWSVWEKGDYSARYMPVVIQ